MSKKVEIAKKEEVKVQAKNPKLFLGIKGEPTTFAEVKKQGERYFQGLDGAASVQEALVRPAMVINRNNHNITLAYDGEAIIIPPRGREKIADFEKLGRLPVGITVLPL